MEPSHAPDQAARAAAIKRAMDILSEHYENVQILGSYCYGGETFSIHEGRGNVYARIAHAEEWVLGQKTGESWDAERRLKAEDENG